MSFRRASLDDLHAYRELVHSAYAVDERVGVHFGAYSASDADVLEHLLTQPTWLRVDGPTLLSAASVRLPWSDSPGPWGIPHLSWIATAPSHQREGHARAMVEHVQTELRQADLGIPALSLGTAREHPWRGHMYSTMGFRYVMDVDLGLGHITQYYVLPLDRTLFDTWLRRSPIWKEYQQ